MTAPRRLAGVDELIDKAVAGQPAAIARLITLVENGAPAVRRIAAALVPRAGRAQVIGLTGPPGVGKSTSTSALVARLRLAGRRVGVLAVDPSSALSGGALLGDRVRMTEHGVDEGVFIRSMASRGHLGGLAAAVPQALRVLDAAGFDVILLETVGVGQAEFEVSSLADTTVLLLAPGLGDGIQAAKAGILEMADVFVINKADRDGAEQAARDLRHLRTLVAESPGQWRRPILKTVATRGEGVDEVLAAIADHHEWLSTTGALAGGRRARAAVEIEAIALGAVRQRFAAVRGSAALGESAARMAEGAVDPFTAADDLVTALGV